MLSAAAQQIFDESLAHAHRRATLRPDFEQLPELDQQNFLIQQQLAFLFPRLNPADQALLHAIAILRLPTYHILKDGDPDLSPQELERTRTRTEHIYTALVSLAREIGFLNTLPPLQREIANHEFLTLPMLIPD